MLAKGVGRWAKFVTLFKRGWNEIPYLYASATLGIASIIILPIRLLHIPPGGYITRYKERYIVMRPEDPRIVGYPKEYITDNHLLK